MVVLTKSVYANWELDRGSMGEGGLILFYITCIADAHLTTIWHKGVL